jgi:hypothetical protein
MPPVPPKRRSRVATALCALAAMLVVATAGALHAAEHSHERGHAPPAHCATCAIVKHFPVIAVAPPAVGGVWFSLLLPPSPARRPIAPVAREAGAARAPPVAGI